MTTLYSGWRNPSGIGTTRDRVGGYRPVYRLKPPVLLVCGVRKWPKVRRTQAGLAPAITRLPGLALGPCRSGCRVTAGRLL